MGSYASLKIGEREIINVKNVIPREFSILFSNVDYNEKNSKNGSEKEMFYRTTIKIMKQRLKILGYTIDRAKDVFESTEFYNYESEDEEYRRHSLNEWSKVITKFLKKYNTLSSIYHLDYHERKNLDSIEQDIIDDDYLFGFSDENFCLFLIAILNVEYFRECDEITLDITDLYYSGWLDDPIQIFENSLEDIANENRHFNKVIILAEGVSDIRIISESMRIRYPEYFYYYGFMDFKSVKLGGSASNLVSIIKSFAAAGINNKIIALFDNDTAAYDATKKIKEQKFPSNIKILHYPDLEIAKEYPTLGPTGLEMLDINRYACSIELYLGRDILENIDGNLTPIQWTGYNAALQKYQGEIINKKEIQEKYESFLKENKLEALSNHDWSGMDILLQSIFNA